MSRQRHSRKGRSLGLFLVVFSSAIGCNLLTGVSKLDVVGDEDTKGDGGSSLGGDASNAGSDSGSGGVGDSTGGMAGGSSSGGGSLGGASSSGGMNGQGSGGAVPTDCDFDEDCAHPDACLVGDCQTGQCYFTKKTCPSDRTCQEGECVCGEGQVDCDGACTVGACCPGETSGGCGNCGIQTCKGDLSGFECLGEGECSPNETCNSLKPWSDGSSCGCALLEVATCSLTCEKGPCL